MLEKHNVWVELTNPVHGGEGWDFGEILWSPVTSSWKIMEEVKPGDIVLHSLKKNKPHEFVAASIVKKAAYKYNSEPLKPGKWKGYAQYYRIELQNFSQFPKSLPQQDFFSTYEKQLLSLGDTHSFYALSGDKKSITGAAQKYLAAVPDSVKTLLEQWFNTKGVKLFTNVEIEAEDDEQDLSSSGNTKPGKVKTSVTRIIRDTDMIRKIKAKYDNKCQICGRKIILPNGKAYSEGHHLKKLGGLHCGPDIASNVIVLCPYHHTEFDYGVIGIDPNTMLIKHIDAGDPYSGKALAYARSDLDKAYLKYHMDKIFGI